MKYFLYGGCSLEASGKNYMVSLEPVCEALDMEFEEIDDWNCCGASISYAGGNELSIKALNARNIAIAESTGGYDIVAPCSSCYIQMIKTNHELKENEQLRNQINEILKEGNLSFKGSVNVRHIMDVLHNDVGIESSISIPMKCQNHSLGYPKTWTTQAAGRYGSPLTNGARSKANCCTCRTAKAPSTSYSRKTKGAKCKAAW